MARGNNINYKGNAYSETTFSQNCFPSSNKINEAFSMGARGGKEISALEHPNEMVGIWWTLLMWWIKLAFVSFSSKQSLPAGQQNLISEIIELGRNVGRLSVDTLHERGRRVAKFPHDVDNSAPRVWPIDGHLWIAIGGVSGLKLKLTFEKVLSKEKEISTGKYHSLIATWVSSLPFPLLLQFSLNPFPDSSSASTTTCPWFLPRTFACVNAVCVMRHLIHPSAFDLTCMPWRQRFSHEFFLADHLEGWMSQAMLCKSGWCEKVIILWVSCMRKSYHLFS